MKPLLQGTNRFWNIWQDYLGVVHINDENLTWMLSAPPFAGQAQAIGRFFFEYAQYQGLGPPASSCGGGCGVCPEVP